MNIIENIKKIFNFKKSKNIKQYSKIAITVILISSIIWISYSYALATIALLTYQNVNPLETLSIEVCRTIIFTVLAYFCKAFFEKYAEENNILKREILQYNNDTSGNSVG